MSWMVSMDCRSSAALEKALTAIGTFWMFSSTRWAVTTSSETSGVEVWAAAPPPARSAAPNAANETP